MENHYIVHLKCTNCGFKINELSLGEELPKIVIFRKGQLVEKTIKDLVCPNCLCRRLTVL